LSGEPWIVVRGLEQKVGGEIILGPLDLDLLRSECLAIVGPNGAGKTTLLRSLAGLLRPSRGEITLAGRSLASHSRRELARAIAYVPQVRPSRIPLKVGEIVLLGRYPHLPPLRMAPGAEDFAAVERALTEVGIGHLRERPVDELSGGERQAVFIAAALAQEADLLILDEPTIHLDALHQHDLATLLLRLKASSLRTIVFATHDLNLASLLGDRLLAIRSGRPLALGPPSAIVKEEVLRELFSARFEVLRGGERPVTVLDYGH
jgi:iron complex transport system ATP-binding protein